MHEQHRAKNVLVKKSDQTADSRHTPDQDILGCQSYLSYHVTVRRYSGAFNWHGWIIYIDSLVFINLNMRISDQAACKMKSRLTL